MAALTPEEKIDFLCSVLCNQDDNAKPDFEAVSVVMGMSDRKKARYNFKSMVEQGGKYILTGDNKVKLKDGAVANSPVAEKKKNNTPKASATSKPKKSKAAAVSKTTKVDKKSKAEISDKPATTPVVDSAATSSSSDEVTPSTPTGLLTPPSSDGGDDSSPTHKTLATPNSSKKRGRSTKATAGKPDSRDDGLEVSVNTDAEEGDVKKKAKRETKKQKEEKLGEEVKDKESIAEGTQESTVEINVDTAEDDDDQGDDVEEGVSSTELSEVESI